MQNLIQNQVDIYKKQLKWLEILLLFILYTLKNLQQINEEDSKLEATTTKSKN